MMKDYFANVRKVYAGIEYKVTKYDWGKEVVPGITSIATPGHTPGHTFRGRVRRSKILIQSDVTNIPELFLRIRTGTSPRYRSRDGAGDPAQFYDMAAAEKATVVGFHSPSPRSAMSRRTARNIAWCRSPGIP